MEGGEKEGEMGHVLSCRNTRQLSPASCLAWWSLGEGVDRALRKGGSETGRETSGQMCAEPQLGLDL